MNRFFIEPSALTGDKIVIPEDIANQIRRVLRLREGEHTVFLDNRGNSYECEICYNAERVPEARILKKSHEISNEPSCFLTLYLALTQREKLEWILQKCTEAGISRIVPMVTERSLVRNVKDVLPKMERWRKIIKEAAEQSARGLIPELAEPVSYREAVITPASDMLKLFFFEDEKHETLRMQLEPQQKKIHEAAMMIGPEGGFSQEEVVFAVENGWKSTTLGKRIYRLETAAIAATILTLYELER